ncbi:hypothetical protein H0H92_014314 [Tricholoma furcatifolium]|nr:hypothetical protein H0H92_014314 [Tricholoma furcatifolium]
MDSDKMAVDTATSDEQAAPPAVPPVEETSDVRSEDAGSGVQREGSSGVIEDKRVAGLTAEDALTSEPIAEPAQPAPASPLPMAVDEPVPVAGPSTSTPTPTHSYPTQPLDRPLNVTDALSYLDAVKVQFSDQPTVYNQFLDIMKEFKNEKIDTPGVIKRVSQLFNGHPLLIQGFNTFLPIGYRIECSDDYNGGLITVTTPSGRQLQTTNNGGKGPIVWSESTADGSFAPAPIEDVRLPPSQPRTAVASPAPPASYPVNGQAIEPAVQYVQKIKQRCDPETYRQFLDILSQYHANPDSINEEEVSKQIARLFKDAPDLRADFRIFMPERSQQNLDDPSPGRSTPSASTDAKGKRKLDTVANNASNLPQKRKRKAAEKNEREREREREAGSARSAGAGSKKTKHQDIPASSSSYSKLAPPSPRRTAHSHTHPHSQAHPSAPPSARMQMSTSTSMSMPPPNQPPSAGVGAGTGTDDTHFFDNVRRVLDNRDTYNEFLKLINLFTQDFIDSARLVHEARNFLGESELMRQLKGILGWGKRERERVGSGRERAREGWGWGPGWEYEYEGQGQGRAEQSWTRPRVVGIAGRPTQAELNMQYGSYRRIPASEANVTCSGRDEMCRSVLNDEWVSHPTWSSEDTGFFSPRKNMYEEALHRSEEERHEYDFHLDAISRTIGVLEPIAAKLASLPPEDRAALKLKPNFNNAWRPLHTRVLKKLYGRVAGAEVASAMQDAPGAAVPLLLARLRAKEDEWRRAQREWNKVWREVDARNYVRALDAQGIAFKVLDKKALAARALVSQIEAAREEQIATRAALIDPLFARTRPRHQLEFVVDDVCVLQDVLKLAFSFLDRTFAAVGFVERKRVEGFLRSFVPLFFMLDPVAFNECFASASAAAAAVAVAGLPQEAFESELSGDDAGSGADDVEVASVASGTASTSSRRQRKGALSSGGDLRKKLLKSEQVKATTRKTRAGASATAPGTPVMSRLASPVPVSVFAEEDPRAGAGAGVGVGAGVGGDPFAHSRKLSRKNIFFTNTNFYVLLRLIEVLYSRLSLFKSIAARLAAAAAEGSPSRHTALAAELQLPPTLNVPNAAERFGKAEHYYDLFLQSVERLFDNEMEQYAFEDQMRIMFGTKEAYKSFTLDKIIGAIIKQVQAIFADPKSQDILEILKKERALVSPTTQDQINSRRNAEKVLGPDENLFRIDWLPESRTMTVQLIGKDDSSFDDSEVLTGRWQAYIDSYVSHDITEGVSPAKVKSPFLRRSLPRSSGDTPPPPTTVSRDALEIKVCVRTYRLFFVSNTEDYMWAVSSEEERKAAAEHLRKREVLRRKWHLDALGSKAVAVPVPVPVPV